MAAHRAGAEQMTTRAAERPSCRARPLRATARQDVTLLISDVPLDLPSAWAYNGRGRCSACRIDSCK